MLRGVALCCAMSACAGFNPGPEAVSLDGPTEVHVRQLGPVAEAPHLRSGDGSVLEPEHISASPESVARIQDGVVHAVGAGTAIVEVTDGGQALTWTLVVEPQPVLLLIDPPARLRVGDRHALVVHTSAGDGHITWATHDESIATVTALGHVVAHSGGTVWVTAKHASGAEATVELLIEAP